jgi:hypothetical protein
VSLHGDRQWIRFGVDPVAKIRRRKQRGTGHSHGSQVFASGCMLNFSALRKKKAHLERLPRRKRNDDGPVLVAVWNDPFSRSRKKPGRITLNHRRDLDAGWLSTFAHAVAFLVHPAFCSRKAWFRSFQSDCASRSCCGMVCAPSVREW